VPRCVARIGWGGSFAPGEIVDQSVGDGGALACDRDSRTCARAALEIVQRSIGLTPLKTVSRYASGRLQLGHRSCGGAVRASRYGRPPPAAFRWRVGLTSAARRTSTDTAEGSVLDCGLRWRVRTSGSARQRRLRSLSYAEPSPGVSPGTASGDGDAADALSPTCDHAIAVRSPDGASADPFESARRRADGDRPATERSRRRPTITSTPVTAPPQLRCPSCNRPLAYRETASRRSPIERWDYFECARAARSSIAIAPRAPPFAD